MLMKGLQAANATINIFQGDELNITRTFLQQLRSENVTNLQELPGKYPGSWTLPICNVGSWGIQWNWNYNDGNVFGDSHPPCMCGRS